MARSLRVQGRAPSLWSRLGPNWRLVFGALIILVVGLFGLTPKAVFGVTLIWPFAALWGAVGWGRVGLSLRPILALVAFGMAQDVAFYAPIGSFVIVNLLVYGASAALSEQYDIAEDPVLSWAAPAALLFGGFMALWTLASMVADHPVALVPLLGPALVTMLLYVPLQTFFHLGHRPGEFAGAGV